MDGYLSPAMLDALSRRVDQDAPRFLQSNPDTSNQWPRSLFGMQLQTSTMFPMETACTSCNGSGEGLC